MKTAYITMMLVFVYATSLHAQNFKGLRLDKIPPKSTGFPLTISPKAGQITLIGAMKDVSFLNRGMAAGFDLNLPIWSKTVKTPNSFTTKLGLEGSIDFGLLNTTGGLDFVKGLYRRSDGAITPDFTSAIWDARSLQFLAGPKLSLGLWKLSISPGIQLGYMSFQRDAYTISDTLSQNGVQKVIPFLSAKEVKVNGLIVRPRLQIGYNIARNMQLWLGSNMTYGPSINNDYTIWQPNSGPQENKTYSFDQLVNGMLESSNTTSPYKSMAYEMGLNMDLGGAPLLKPAIKDPVPNKLIYKGPDNDNDNKIEKHQTDDVYNATAPAKAIPPVITYPANNKTTALLNDDLQFAFKRSNTNMVKYQISIWDVSKSKKTLVMRDTFPNNWDGTIHSFGRLYGMPRGTTNNYQAQLQALPCAECINKDTITNDYHAVTPKGQPLFENNGLSNLVSFTISNNCFPQLGVELDSAKCADSNKTKVWGHIMLNNVTGVTVTSIVITDFKQNNFSGPPVSISNLVPGTNIPPVNNSQFSFTVNENMCNKVLFIRLLVTYTCILTGESVSVPCADTIAMPCCLCSYCSDSMKISSVNSSINNTGNIAQISQSFTVTPTNITEVTAEIVYISDSVNDEVCRTCDKKPDHVYHFTGTNTMSWNGGTPVNASASNNAQAFPSKAIIWQANNQGNVSFNLSIELPDLPNLDCCTMSSRICIRYTFTDKNCKTCDVLICYTLDRGKSTKKAN